MKDIKEMVKEYIESNRIKTYSREGKVLTRFAESQVEPPVEPQQVERQTEQPKPIKRPTKALFRS
jgi:hypothetical protein